MGFFLPPKNLGSGIPYSVDNSLFNKAKSLKFSVLSQKDSVLDKIQELFGLRVYELVNY